MVTVFDANGILVTAMMTPPHNITLYATNNLINQEAIKCLIDGLKEYEIPGVTTEKNLAMFFAEEYAASKKLSFEITMSQCIYELTQINSNVKQFGSLRLLNENDLHFFPYWLEAFHAANIYGKTEMKIPQDIEHYHYRLSTQKMYVLEVDKVPVAMAGFTKEVQKTICVSFVYTPPYYRSKGYATSCVAQISQNALSKGFTKCVLYTDLLNPASNSIYQKIGYKLICDSLMI